MSNENDVDPSLHKVKQLWGQKATVDDLQRRKYVNWMVHPYIEQHYINKTISGSPEVNWFDYVKNKYIPSRLSLGLNLGCGSGGLEQHALRVGMCERFEAFDVAEGAIDIAKAAAVELGIDKYVTYEATDINHIRLQESKYDIAFASMSAHHFQDLEQVFSQIRKALKPLGLFVLNEFVGPSQFQWTDQQLTTINELLEILPAKYKAYINCPGKFKERLEKPSIVEMNSYDPSEAIRSAEITLLLPTYFNVLELIEYGGTILHTLLQDIVGNFDNEEEESLALLKFLIYVEKILLKNKLLPSDFALVVAQKKHESELAAVCLDEEKRISRVGKLLTAMRSKITKNVGF